MKGLVDNQSKIFLEAQEFIEKCYVELNKQDQIDARLTEIKEELDQKGTYEHRLEELEHGAKMAWRNSNRCIGRLFWNSLRVHDARHLNTEQEIYHALLRHIDQATNQGKIIPTITIFKPNTDLDEVRIWNHQLIRYAGYEKGDGIVGDPASVRFTKACQALGWQGQGSAFDLLPLVIQLRDKEPQWFELPNEKVLEVEIEHPELDWFKELQLKWYAVPLISDMKLEIGGIHYTAAPFNGWYMGTEIGARNLADEGRYDMLPTIAQRMGLDTSRNATLWKDKALAELNIAVLHSYKQAGVSIVDHHTAAEQFKHFERKEESSGRRLTGDWTWLIPPMSPATSHIFHQSYDNTIMKPNYFLQEKPY